MKPLLLLALAVSPVFAKRTVMITSFEPFGGRAENGSTLVARELEKTGEGDIEYKVCVLPVEYDRGAEAAKKCFAQMKEKPDLVISTGEGDCSVRVETQAHNLDDTPDFPDNGGLVRVDHVIEAGAPPEERLTFPAENMVCAAGNPANVVVRPSISPGYYVCNAVAYRLARFFKPKKIPFGFIHLPVGGGCGGKTNPAELAVLLRKMASEALRVTDLSTSIFGKDCVDCRRIREAKPVPSLVTAACVTQVRETLRLLHDREREAARQRGDIAGPAAGKR